MADSLEKCCSHGLRGMQLTWILRPFFGSPDFPVQFLRPDALKGNFIEGFISIIRPLFET
jgi:hypothetical protein